MSSFMIADLNALEAVRCPCGFAKRVFATPDNAVATRHVVDIQHDSRTHYHQRMTEIYLVLEGEGRMVQAKNWLAKVVAAGGAAQIKAMALGDADLKPLWPVIEKF